MKKLKKLITIFSTAVTLSITSCGISLNDSNNFDKIVEKMTYEENINNEQELKEQKLKEIYQSLVDNVKLQYKNIEYYPLDSKIKNMMNYSLNNYTCPYQLSYNIDYDIDQLVKQIEENSKKYIKDNKEYYYELNNKLDEISDLYLKQLDTNKILKESLTNIFKNATNDINEDFCYLKDVKLVFSNQNNIEKSIVGTFDKKTKEITIYVKNIICDLEQKMEYSENKNYDLYYNFVLIISHEINHARQKNCIHKKDFNFSIYGSTLVESSAESALYNQDIDILRKQKEDYEYTYNKEREDESLLFLIGITNKNLDKYYNAIYDADLFMLYNFLNLENYEDIKSLHHILYAIDSKNNRTNLSTNLLKEISYSDLESAVGYEYKIDIFKLIIKNLIKYTVDNKDYNLEENYNLFMIIRNYILDGTSKTVQSENGEFTVSYDDEFANNFKYLNEVYIEFLKEIYDVTDNDLSKIEDDNYSYEVYKISINKYITSDEKESKAKKLIERFPIIKSIIYTNSMTLSNYSIFNYYINEKSKVLIK